MKIKPQIFMDVDQISTRHQVNFLEEMIKDLAQKKNDHHVAFDFSEIKMISRSAADELLMAQQRAKMSGIDLSFLNLNEFNSKMLKMVESRITHPSHRKPAVKNISVLDLC
jgi:anti-anti-sigma regulatory factor